MTIADEPENYTARLERVLPRLKQLRISVPEKHDLVLMKSTRAYEHDIQVIRETATAKNYATFANTGGLYDDLLAYLNRKP